MNTCKPRVESFFKTRGELVSAVKKWGNEILGINLTNKSKEDTLIEDARVILASVKNPIDICVHFSVKYNWRSCGRSKEAQIAAGKKLLDRWNKFYDEADSSGIQRILLISGSPPKKKVDSIEILKHEAHRRNTQSRKQRVRIGVAWTPCYPEGKKREEERARLSSKLSTGIVNDIWLQFSNNCSLLREELLWLKQTHGIDGTGTVKLYGSIFVPTKIWLNRFRFSPWTGVFVDTKFLSNVECAMQGAQSVLDIYNEMNVSPLIESPIRKDTDLLGAKEFLQRGNGIQPNAVAKKDIEKAALTPGDSDSSATKKPVVMLLRNELRLRDNPLMVQAASLDCPVIPLYIWSRQSKNRWTLEDSACAIWLQESLKNLDKNLRDAYDNPLIVRYTNDDQGHGLAKCAVAFAKEVGAKSILLGERYDGMGVKEDRNLIEVARREGIMTKVVVTSALHDPSAINLSSGQKGYFHWGTLMPFLRACEKRGTVPRPLDIPMILARPKIKVFSEKIAFVKMPKGCDWGKNILRAWPKIGEDSAHAALRKFIVCTKAGLMAYEKKRSRADIDTSSAHLSPHLRFGEISPRTVYWSVKDKVPDRSITKTFLRRLYWRDLAYFHNIVFPEMSDVGIRKHYDQTLWTCVSSEPGRSQLKAWKQGKTGFPIVDAGMRELHETGWMNQSVRMVAASFLCEVLNIDWRQGEHHFHRELIDTDISINAMMWQNAGRCGIDQWNFFMSPINASQDPTGAYTRKWVPELSKLPSKYLHKPWTSPAGVLSNAGVVLGSTYPNRICMDISAARGRTTACVLDMRRNNMKLNDEGGYDVIVLPNGERSRVFTRKDLRLNSDGSVKTFKGKGKSQSNIGRRKPLVQRKGHQKTITKYFENTKKRRVDSQTLTFPNTGE